MAGKAARQMIESPYSSANLPALVGGSVLVAVIVVAVVVVAFVAGVVLAKIRPAIGLE